MENVIDWTISIPSPFPSHQTLLKYLFTLPFIYNYIFLVHLIFLKQEKEKQLMRRYWIINVKLVSILHLLMENWWLSSTVWSFFAVLVVRIFEDYQHTNVLLTMMLINFVSILNLMLCVPIFSNFGHPFTFRCGRTWNVLITTILM